MAEQSKNNRVTGADIAEYLGVTPATVSRALAGNPRISAAMQKKVRDAARQLGYVSNAAARSLVKGYSNIVGILSGGLQIERTAMELIALDAELRKKGFLPCILYTKSDIESIVDGARSLIERGVDGLLIIGCAAGAINEWRCESISHLKPTVFVDTPLVKHDVSMVCNDYTQGYRQAGDILENKKRSHIHALMKYNPNRSVPGLKDSRFDGVAELLERFQCQKNIHFIMPLESPVRDDTADLRGHYSAVLEKMLTQDPLCDAIICNDDDIAVHCMGVLQQQGKKIPEDISLLGFSNTQICGLVTPQLSSIAPQPQLMGRKAVETLLALIKDPDSVPVHLQVPGKLIDRQTL